MRIMYIAPRFHTNQYYLVKHLVEDGNVVFFLTQYEGVCEDHTIISPKQMSPSILSKVIDRIIDLFNDSVAAELKKVKCFIPSFYFLINMLKHAYPDLIIYRERSLCTFVAFLAAKLCHVKCNILYDQAPLYRQVREVRIRTVIKQVLFPRVRITPVQFEELLNNNSMETKYVDRYAYFVPFVVDTLDSFDDHIPHDGTLRLLDIGKYRDYKNHYLIIDAIDRIHDRIPLRLTVIGQGNAPKEIEYMDNLKKYIAKKGLESIISVNTNILFHDIQTEYLVHDALILASKRETAGAVVYEAMAHGLPAISSSANGTASYIIHGKTGYVFKTGDVNALASCIELLFSNAVRLHEMGLDCINHMKDLCSYEVYKKTISNILLSEFNDRVRFSINR